MSIQYNLSKTELIYIIRGYEPDIDVMDDDGVKKCGYLSGPAFSYRNDIWYWREFNIMNKLSMNELLRILKVIKKEEPKVVNDIKNDESINPPLPKFVRLKNSTLRLKGNEYYRDGGMWGVKYEHRGGVLFSVSYMENLDNVELIEVTENEYAKDNKGYYNKK